MEPSPEQIPRAEQALAEFATLKAGREAFLEMVLDRFTTIAHIIGHDFGMKVDYGAPFGGNYFTYPPPSVVLDPVHVLRDIDEAEFIVEHEGAHRYNTYSVMHPELEPILKNMFPIETLVNAIGFNGVFNGIEDPTINRWLTDVYTGTREKMVATYDRMFQNDETKLYAPDVQLYEMVLGFYPKFGVFLSAVVRKWHSGSWGKNIDTDVLQALEATSDTVDRMMTMTVNKTGAPEQERQFMCLRRYVSYISSVWPVVKKLIADDIEEAGYKAFRQAIKNNPSIGKPPQRNEPSSQPQQGQSGEEQEGEQGTEQGEPQGEEQNQSEQNGKSAPGKSSEEGDAPENGEPSNAPGKGAQPPEESPEEGGQQGAGAPQEMIDDLLNQLPEQVKQELRELLKTLRGEEKPESPDADEGDGKQTGASENGDGRPDDAEPSEGKGEGGSSPEQPEEGKDDAGSGDPSGDGKPSNEKGKQTVPGQGTEPAEEGDDRDLREFYNKLFPQQRGGFEDRGKENLKKFEDALNKYFRGHLDPFQTPTHEEREARKNLAQSVADRRESEFKAAKLLDEYRLARLSAWDRSLETQGEHLLRLTNNLRRILKPVSPERQGGFISGSELSLPDVFQDEARQVPTHRIFARTTLPTIRDYFFQIVADRSDSMAKHRKSHHNLNGVVLASEAFQRVRAPFELSTFDSSFLLLKDRNQQFGAEEKKTAGSAILHCSGGTADYVAIREMRMRARAVRALFKVMFVTSDGESNNANLLRRELEQCGQEGLIVIGLGIGPDTAHVDRNYRHGRGFLTLGDFTDPNSFMRYFTEIIEEIVKDPWKFYQISSSKE